MYTALLVIDGVALPFESVFDARLAALDALYYRTTAQSMIVHDCATKCDIACYTRREGRWQRAESRAWLAFFAYDAAILTS